MSKKTEATGNIRPRPSYSEPFTEAGMDEASLRRVDRHIAAHGDDGSHGQISGRPVAFTDDFGDYTGPTSELPQQDSFDDAAGLLAWMMRDRIQPCDCHSCDVRRRLLTLPQQLARRPAPELRDSGEFPHITAINNVVMHMVCEIADADRAFAARHDVGRRLHHDVEIIPF